MNKKTTEAALVLILLGTLFIGFQESIHLGDRVDKLCKQGKYKVVDPFAKELVRVNGMASWVVSGAGTAGYNGTYEEDTVGYPSGYNGYAVYKLDATHYMYCNGPTGVPSPDKWVLGASPSTTGGAYAGDSEVPTLPDAQAWHTIAGSEPAPTVAEATTEQEWGEFCKLQTVTFPDGVTREVMLCPGELSIPGFFLGILE